MITFRSLNTSSMGFRSGEYGGSRMKGMPLFSRISSPAASWIGELSKRRTQLGA